MSATHPPAPRVSYAVDPLHPEQAKRRWTRARVDSSHVNGQFDDGLLTLRFAFESPTRRMVRRDEIWFAVPPEFHTHNDSVAAAVMTMLSTSVGAVTFNFSISEYCATLLRDYYRLTNIGPVEPALEPRRAGRWVGLNFSGGLDSLVVKLLLDDIQPEGYRLITSDYGGPYAHEALGYAPYQPHVVCHTNFRSCRLTNGRFNCAVPLLFADYLDLESLTTGHAFTQNPESTESLIDGAPPHFLLQEAALRAGGLDELHLARGLNEPGMVKAVMRLPHRQLEQLFNGSGPPGSAKYRVRGTILRQMLEAAGEPLPAFLDGVVLGSRTNPPGVMLGGVVQFLYIARFIGIDAIRAFFPSMERAPADWLASLSLEFSTRYNTNFIGLLPEQLRAPLLAALARRGIEPYAERDWWELSAVRDFRYALETTTRR